MIPLVLGALGGFALGKALGEKKLTAEDLAALGITMREVSTDYVKKAVAGAGKTLQVNVSGEVSEQVKELAKEFPLTVNKIIPKSKDATDFKEKKPAREVSEDELPDFIRQKLNKGV